MKHQFRILLLAAPFSLSTQACIPTALCVVHNFIRIHDPSNGDLSDDLTVNDQEGSDLQGGLGAEGLDDQEEMFNADNLEMHALWNHIAERMWQDYQEILANRQVDGIH